MESSQSDALAAISEVVYTETDIIVAMRRLLRVCATAIPSPHWEKISLLDFSEDANALRAWLQDLLTAERPPDTVAAYWFGIFDAGDSNPEGEEEDDNGAHAPMAQLYLSGSEIYDPDDQQAEWACSPEYFPQGRYANSRVLRSISEIMRSADDDAFELGMFALPLGFAALTAAQACRQIPADLWLGASDCRAAAVGFDSGGFLTLPEIRR